MQSRQMRPFGSALMAESRIYAATRFVHRPARRMSERAGVSRVAKVEVEQSAAPEQPVAKGEVTTGIPQQVDSTASIMEFDEALEQELASPSGHGKSRQTKLICTIGPASCSYDTLSRLAEAGMNVARLNMTHGTHEWHKSVIDNVRKLNKEKGYCVAVMMDTEGSEIHTGELAEPIRVVNGTEVIFTVRTPAPSQMGGTRVIGLPFDCADDLQVGDSIVIDGGMVEMVVRSIEGPDVRAVSIEAGLILSAANLTFKREGELIRGRQSTLPVITAKDWRDIDFAIQSRVDFLAISFVRTGDVITNLRSYITSRCPPDHTIELVAKVEAADSLPHLDDIIEAADGVMVARGDLGAQIPVEDVPSVQKYIAVRGRQLGKPVIVAHQLLQSMMEYPIPTRAEVSDVADVVRQRADALMLSGESAVGQYPVKSLDVLRSVATRIESWVQQERFGAVVLPQIGGSADGRVSEELCASAAQMANNLKAAAILVYTRRGYMAHFLSRCRPDCTVYAFTDTQHVRQRLNLRWGVVPFKMDFAKDPEENVQRSFHLLSSRGLLKAGDRCVVVSDLRPNEKDIIRSVQVRYVR